MWHFNLLPPESSVKALSRQCDNWDVFLNNNIWLLLKEINSKTSMFGGCIVCFSPCAWDPLWAVNNRSWSFGYLAFLLLCLCWLLQMEYERQVASVRAQNALEGDFSISQAELSSRQAMLENASDIKVTCFLSFS